MYCRGSIQHCYQRHGFGWRSWPWGGKSKSPVTGISTLQRCRPSNRALRYPWRIEQPGAGKLEGGGCNGTLIFDKCLGCGDPGAFTLALGGVYTIIVGKNTNDGTGAYQFQITNQ
jgi:hypothetical protein